MAYRATATQFHRFMSNGRTCPALCGCEGDEDGHTDDYVVKLRGGMDRGERGLVCELLGSRLATYFGIAVPEPALIMIEADFAELVASTETQRAGILRNSVGLNFGCRLLNDVTVWPIDRALPDAMLQAAVNVFAFDALIQNPDRRFDNQNLFTRGSDVFAFDHELAFSFVLDILPAPEPWHLNGQSYLTNHVFFRQLQSQRINIDGFVAALGSLPGPNLDGMLSELPPAWNNEDVDRIERHLRVVSDRAGDFAEEIRRRLA